MVTNYYQNNNQDYIVPINEDPNTLNQISIIPNANYYYYYYNPNDYYYNIMSNYYYNPTIPNYYNQFSQNTSNVLPNTIIRQDSYTQTDNTIAIQDSSTQTDK